MPTEDLQCRYLARQNRAYLARRSSRLFAPRTIPKSMRSMGRSCMRCGCDCGRSETRRGHWQDKNSGRCEARLMSAEKAFRVTQNNRGSQAGLCQRPQAGQQRDRPFAQIRSTHGTRGGRPPGIRAVSIREVHRIPWSRQDRTRRHATACYSAQAHQRTAQQDRQRDQGNQGVTGHPRHEALRATRRHRKPTQRIRSHGACPFRGR